MGIFLTTFRRRVLGLLAEYHYLRTPDFYGLLQISDPHEQRGTRRALMLLARAGLVLRSRQAVDDPSDAFLRYQHCYRLSRAGCHAIGGGQAAIEKSPASIDHELLITDFHIALSAGVPGTHRVYWRQSDLKRTVHPDALFAITNTTRPRELSTFYYFLEAEYSRQGHYRAGESGLIAKLRRYSEYRRSAACREEWKHFSDFRVVVVLRTRERQENLLRVLKKKLPIKALWTTTTDDVQRDIVGPIFRGPPDPSSATSLFDDPKGEQP
jgi:protein involved in plasmid replication-relaxation